MNLLPNEEFYIVTKLSPEQVQAKLDEMVDISNYQFSGYAAGPVFKLQPVADYKKSFGIEVQGVVEKSDTGSRINVRMQLPKNTALFLSICVGILLVAGVMGLIDMAISKDAKHDIFPWFIFFLIYFPWISSFQTQSKKTKALLINIFEGE